MMETIPQGPGLLPLVQRSFFSTNASMNLRDWIINKLKLRTGPRYTSDDLQKALKAFKLTQEIGKSTSPGESRFKATDGRYRWHLVSILPIEDKAGQVQLWIGTATAIHNLKELQQQDDFIAIASHELKTPITSLKASLQLLTPMKDKPSKIADKLFEQANKSMGKVTVLIEELLNSSNFTQELLHLNKKFFKFSKLINDCKNHL